MIEPITITRSVTAHGWLRRPELDTQHQRVWELPDGRLYAHRRGDPPPEIVQIILPQPKL